MSERYSKLFSLPENLYATGAPVVIAAGALLKDNQTGKVLAQLKLRNIGKETIKAATVCVEPLDTVGKPLGEPVTYQYLDLHADRDADFGQKTPVPLPDSATRSFAVSVVQVIFSDNSIWNDDSPAWKPLTRPQPLDALGDSELTKQFRIEYGDGCENLLLEQKDLWHCVCGGVNHQEEANCHKCGKALSELQAIDMEGLRQNKEERVAKECAEAEARRIQTKKEAEIARAKAKKVRRIIGIVAVLAVIAVLVVNLFQQVIIPNNRYNEALALMEAGQYDEAIAAFEAMDGYSDSVDKVSECNYLAAMDMMEAGRYDEAIAMFEAMDGYKDSVDKVSECNYFAAVDLMETGRYDEAITAFEGMDGYRDSLAKIEACQIAVLDEQYNAAVVLMEAGRYDEAIAAFEGMDGYKDSITQIENCNIAILDAKYEAAVVLMDSGNTVEAYESFIALDGYKDSTDTANSIYDEYKIEKLKTAQVGDYVIFGSYEQDGNISNSKEDIEWLVLEKSDNRILVISKYALDCQRYNTTSKYVTWETCSLRTWLNGTFLNTAFSSEEQAMIPTVTVSADKNPSYSTAPGKATHDNVFLLSVTEVDKYFSSDSAKQCKPTDYAVANGAGNGNCYWWLRLSGLTSTAPIVGSEGVIYGNYHVYYCSDAVRPALWIDLSAF